MHKLTFVMIFFLAGCIPAQTALPPLKTDTPQPSETPTSTIVWFPPTSTFTPLPIQTRSLSRTVQPDAQYGELILQDNFDLPQLWTVGKFSSGNILIGINELSIGIAAPEGYLASMRNESAFGDFYLEITANPSICRGKDEYGVLFHVSSAVDFFRFGLNCSGEARLDRLLGGNASSPHPPTKYGAIPPGAPSASRIGIWSVGKLMRFFVNGVFLFSIEDSSHPSGGLGVYARAGGQDSMTINFLDLKLYEPNS